MQQQIFIAAALLYNAPHNTQASCASALAGQMPALPPAISTQRSLLPLAAVLCSLLCSALTMMQCLLLGLLHSGTLEQTISLNMNSARDSKLKHIAF